MIRKGNLIRCSRDNDIGVVLWVNHYEYEMGVYWMMDGLSTAEEMDSANWYTEDLFTVIA